MILCRSRWRKAKYRVSSTHFLSLRSWSIKFLYDLATTTGRLSRCRSCLLTVLAVPLVVHFLDNVRWVLPEESWVCWRLPGSVGAYQGPRTCCGTRRSCLGEPNRVRCPWISLIKADIWSATRETKFCSRWETNRIWKVKNVLSGCVSFPLNITDVHSSLVHTTEKICNGV